MSAPLTRTRVWGMPAALGMATGVGLIAALVSDGLGDLVSWVALAAPVVVGLGYALKRG